MHPVQKTPLFIGKDAPQTGQVPSIVLCNPNFSHNVGMTVRLASCYGLKQVWFTGERVQLELEKKKRLPREERMKGYRDVTMINYDRPLDQFSKDVVPIAVEVRQNSERLDQFEHPKNAVYVFGPEDGSIPQSILTRCHRFLIIPTQKRYCLNLATAVATILWHRAEQLGELPDVSDGSGIGYQDSNPNEVGVFGGGVWPPEE